MTDDRRHLREEEVNALWKRKLAGEPIRALAREIGVSYRDLLGAMKRAEGHL